MGNISQETEVGSQKPAVQKLLAQILSLAAWLLLPAFALASGGQEIPMSLMDWVWKIVNFGILAALLYVFGWKMIRTHLQQRRELIEKSIRESREAREIAARALAEVEDRLNLKDREVADIIAAAVEAGESEKRRLIEEGEKLKVRILEQAKSNIEFEVKKAKEAIQAEAFDTSLRIAEEKIRSRMTPAEQERLLQESIKLIEGKN
jgi:F-type H+-transporting ATPase subunit b